jgi:hypothetical protein
MIGYIECPHCERETEIEYECDVCTNFEVECLHCHKRSIWQYEIDHIYTLQKKEGSSK